MNKRTLSATLLTVTLALTASACSGKDKDGDTSPKAKSSASDSPTAVNSEGISPAKLPDLPVFKDERGGDIKDLTLGDCATDPGKQVVTGELTSTLNKRQDFVVSISWTTSTGDVMGRGFKVVKGLQPGKTAKFKITADVSEGATRCVSGVAYGVVKG